MFRVPVVDLRVTGVCNLGCRYCFGEIDSKAGMERHVFLRALDFAEHAGAKAIEFCGGEPLLYKDFSWAVGTALERGFTLILRTNAIHLAAHRALVASSFDYVGISLDGDAATNDVMRPTRKASSLSIADKFEIPLQEVVALKSLNPALKVILASVATRVNLDGLRALASILVRRQLPIDLWKIYQFLPNHFRARLNADEFSLSSATFQYLTTALAAAIDGAFPLICSPSDAIDGSCLVVSRDGDVLLGAQSLGSVCNDAVENIYQKVQSANAETAILANKTSTYKALFRDAPLLG